MHQIDRGVGLQQVAPCPLAGVRLAGHQQHAQPVAHTVHREHGPVVAVGQLALGHWHREFDDVRPAMADRDLDGHAAPDEGRHAERRRAVDREPHRRRHAVRCGAEGDHAHDGRDGVADDAEGGRGLHRKAVVLLALLPGQQQVDRAGKRGHAVGIVHLPVRDQYGAGNAVLCHLGGGVLEGREQQRAAVGQRVTAGPDADRPHIERRFGARAGRQPLQRFGQCLAGVTGLFGAAGDALARAVVDHHEGDVGQRPAVLAHERWVGDGEQQRGEGECPQAPARRLAPEGQRHHGERQHAARDHERPWRQRREGERRGHPGFLIAPDAPAAPAHAPDRTCSCRSAHTSQR